MQILSPTGTKWTVIWGTGGSVKLEPWSNQTRNQLHYPNRLCHIYLLIYWPTRTSFFVWCFSRFLNFLNYVAIIMHVFFLLSFSNLLQVSISTNVAVYITFELYLACLNALYIKEIRMQTERHLSSIYYNLMQSNITALQLKFIMYRCLG